MSDMNTDILNQLIVGRVEPHIYAFSTKTVPDYLKVGDTYRPIEKRLDEWRKYFPNLERKFSEVAKVDDEIFFRDYAIHTFLETSGKTRLQKGIIDKLPYFSNKFFKDAQIEDVENAILDVKDSHTQNDGRYQFYRFDESRIPINFKWERTSEYEPRPNQQKAIDNFNAAIKNGRTNLLMYAVMRFGKSFTSMCCATEMNAKFVVIVSAKADVKAEWKKTVESHKRFEGYEFLDSESLLRDENVITDKLKDGRIALFLTLQDLQGDDIKAKHKEVFESQIDLLLIDETHFGARGNEYGKVLRDIGISKAEQRKELSQSDEDLSELGETIKTLNTIIRIHLSGTPYRILMGSEFTKEDIIAFCQFTDIVYDQERWNEENINKDEVKEWDNPYYGFPQMIRFAFNPNESSINRMEELKRNGVTYAFSALFKPQSIVKDSKTNGHKKFLHEQEILDLLEVIDGSKKDDNLLGFLDYDKIKGGKMCRHIVCVLSYRASCDALESLIINNKDKFKNLSSYEIINIAGVEDERTFKEIEMVKDRISKCESENIKTITLTVNRMLTGSTVEQWDTMLYLKDTASPQEYDQAIFRLQNQYIKTYKDDRGDTIKYNMKPQTLLVDFDPYRLFHMQEQKSQIYNANIEDNGNDKLEERIKRELEISPVVVMNHNKMQQVTPTDILKAVSEYSSNKSVADEATIIPVDLSLLSDNDIKAEIEKQPEINSKEGLKTKAVEGDGDDIDTPDGEAKDGDDDAAKVDPIPAPISDSDVDSIRKKFATYYSRLLFFAFLTNSKVSSVQDILVAIDANEDNARIAKNLEVSKHILELFRQKMNPFILSKLDYKIQNLNTLANDASLAPLDRATTALRKFGRLSESEIVTPSHVADEMVAILPEDSVADNAKIFDIASKQGEFATALYKRFGEKVKSNIYSSVTSMRAYEFTRKVYEILGMPVENILDKYTSYHIIGENNQEIIKELKDMKFKAIVGNPPYQVMDGGAQASAKPIYDKFVDIAKKIKPSYISMIMPSRWYAGGKGLDEFREDMLNDKHIALLHDFLNPEDVFPNTNIRGGLCFFLWSEKYDNQESLTKVVTHQSNTQPVSIMRSLKTDNSGTFIRHSIALSITEKVINNNHFTSVASFVSAAKAFGFRTFFINDDKFRQNNIGLINPVLCYGRGGARGFVERVEIVSHKEWIDAWKVYVPESNNIGTELNDDNQNSFVGMPNTICTETFLVIGAELNLDENSSANLAIYLRTRFARFQHSLAKVSQHGTSKTYQFVPLQDFTEQSDIDWSVSAAEIDAQLYAKYALTPDEIAFIDSMIRPMEITNE